jgi:hypothetical protein
MNRGRRRGTCKGDAVYEMMIGIGVGAVGFMFGAWRLPVVCGADPGYTP